MSDTPLPHPEYPWEYTDAQGYWYPYLQAVQLGSPGFAHFKTIGGDTILLSQDRVKLRDESLLNEAKFQLDRLAALGQMPPHNPFADITLFHWKMGLGYHGSPRSLEPALELFRTNFIAEEYQEFCTAETDAKKFDACLDMLYVIYGYMYLRGWNVPVGWDRVQRANMNKVRAKGSKYASTRSGEYDVVKPDGWVAPNLEDLVV